MAGEIQKDSRRVPNFYPPPDLSDLRLHPATNVWQNFRTDYGDVVRGIRSLNSLEVTMMARHASALIDESIGMSRIGKGIGSKLSPSKLDAAKEYLSNPGNKIIFMRHGEQSPYQWISEYSDPTIRKIRMMQNPYNSGDPLTNRGFVDVFATAIGVLYLQQFSGRTLTVLSSDYRRADEVGRIFAAVTPGTSFAHMPGLESVSYKSEQDDPSMTLQKLYQELPVGGHMPWDPVLVEKFCRKTKLGGSPSEAIKHAVADILRHQDTPGNDLTIVLTHSQQIAEVLRIRGVMSNPSVRFPELSMIAVDTGHIYISERGLLQEDKGTSVAG